MDAIKKFKTIFVKFVGQFLAHEDHKQAVRLQRVGMAAATWGILVVITFIIFPLWPAIIFASLGTIQNGALFYLIKSNKNLNFADPSLTEAQLYLATTTGAIWLHSVPLGLRGATLMFYILIFSFGMLKLNTRKMILLAIFGMILFGFETYLFILQNPQISNQSDLWWSLCIMGIVVLWFAVFGGHVNQLRNKMRDAKLAAEAASQSQAEFLALMSHELRTPMAGIIGMLKMSMKDSKIKSVHERVLLANQNAESLLNILNDLLDTSKIEAGKLQIEHVDYVLRTELQHAMALLSERTREKSIGFDVVIDDLVPTFVKGDPTRLRQVLLNLVGNAIKFTDQGGVCVLANLIEQKGDVYWTRFEVKDSGIGISEEAMSRLFKKFEQADSSTTRKFGGTGLGLAITKQLVELMGGRIGVRSTPGQGSTFYFDLPLEAGVEPPVELVNAAEPHPFVLQVLCAEDAVTNQVIIKSLLEEMGHHVDLVENGELALHALAHHDYDLILMDGRMPVMDGITATQHIRQGHFGDLRFADPHILIVALTANASDHDRDKFLASGMNLFLTKPINETQLHKTLSGAIEHCQSKGKTLQARQVDAGLSDLDALLGLEAPLESPPAEPIAPTPSAPPMKERMLQVFIDQVPERMAEIKQAMHDQDYDKVAIVVHGIKGSMAYVWPDSPLLELTGQLETWADQRDIHQLTHGLTQLQDLMQKHLSASQKGLT